MGEIKCQEGSSVRLPLPQPSRSQLVETQLAQLQAKNKALEEESLGFWMFLLKTVLFPFSFSARIHLVARRSTCNMIVMMIS